MNYRKQESLVPPDLLQLLLKGKRGTSGGSADKGSKFKGSMLARKGPASSAMLGIVPCHPEVSPLRTQPRFKSVDRRGG